MVSRQNKQYHSKKVVSAVMAGLMVLGAGATSAAADQAATSVSATATASNLFSDVNTGYWGEKYIYQLASQGIVMGNNGKFRPNDPVTQQEAVTMAIRFLNLQVTDSTGASTALPTNIKVNNYFVPYVKLALQQNLLDKTKESGYADTKVTWGGKNATREWITEVLVRSMGRTADASAAMNKATGFADNAKISADRLGYVNVAIDLGIAKGVNGNKFDPQGAVTRAQLATFFSRAQAYIDAKYDNQFEGYVSSVGNGKLELYADGKNNSFTIDGSTAYFEKASEKRLSVSDIKPYTKVTVIGKNGTASYVEITDPEPKLESFERKYARLSPNNVIWFDSNNTFEELKYDSETIFLDQNGTKIDPQSLASGSIVTVERETFSPQKRIVAIRVKNGLVNKTASGIVQSVDTTNKTITIKDASGNTVDTFKWDDSTLIKYQNQLMNVSELKAGSVVTYTVENNILHKIEISQSVDRTITAMLYSMESNGSTLTYKRSGSTQLETKFLVEKPELTINGIDQPLLSDLLADATAGDQVELTVNGEEKITKIKVLGRQMEHLNEVSVVSYVPSKRWLTVSDNKSQPKVIVLDDKTKLDSAGGTNLPTIEALLVPGRKVNINHIGNRALSLEVIYKYDGKVTAINATNKILTLLTEGGQTINVPYNWPRVELYDKPNATLSDIKVGDEVSAQLSNDQTSLISIKAVSLKQFEIVSTEPSYDRVRVKNDGVTSQIYTDKAKISDENGKDIRISDLRSGSLINVKFAGTTPSAVAVVKNTMGQVMSVDPANSVLAIKTFNGAGETIQATGGVKVVRGTDVSTNIASISVNDRVEVRKNIDGTTNIKVLDSVTRNFWRYENGDVYVKRIYTSDNNRFPVAANLYVHQGDQNLSVQSLKENDNIVLYFNNGIVVEIVKQ
ncbi:S-layer homology domain-containing protein [Paenibacillus sp. DMB20]|uniref:S-layer homology domain-containing protein n=1 Tax=Paenibacillus sp. DMB20 TaxID=1642570 RepID=UPI000627C122|nr:S-layer homology domain-containing protein [Paenibacillus sp. DMB20]KKO51887.1 S-layer protein [Paenibacillus sp. DMB20]